MLWVNSGRVRWRYMRKEKEKKVSGEELGGRLRTKTKKVVKKRKRKKNETEMLKGHMLFGL